MSVLLPSEPGPVSAAPAYLDWGGLLRPIFGGATQKLNRLGDRFALTVTLPPMPNATLGRRWIATLIQAQREGAITEFPQYDLDVGTPGAPVVNGAGQAGSMLSLRGVTPGYVIQQGQVFSVVSGGRRYLHMAIADTGVGGGGAAGVPIAPMLRVQPADGALCEIAKPMIEGFVEGDRREWSLDYAMMVGLTFTIQEAR